MWADLYIMRLSFFKTQKPKKFRYQARFFDEEKDRREQRKREMGLGEQSDLKFKHRMQSAWRTNKDNDRKRKKKAELQTMVLIAVLGLVVYYLFFR